MECCPICTANISAKKTIIFSPQTAKPNLQDLPAGTHILIWLNKKTPAAPNPSYSLKKNENIEPNRFPKVWIFFRLPIICLKGANLAPSKGAVWGLAIFSLVLQAHRQPGRAHFALCLLYGICSKVENGSGQNRARSAEFNGVNQML